MTVRDPELQHKIERKLPELVLLERLIKNLGDRVRVKVEATVAHRGLEFPIYSLALGSEDPEAPTLGIFAGVHGLERVGTEVALSYLQSIAELMTWDKDFQERLKRTRLVFMPIINPVGMYRTSRSNGNGVDLMRNSPVTAVEPPAFLLGGHTISNRLPWYRGKTDSAEVMEIESRAVGQVVEREIFPSRVALSVDLHSGFGSVDRLWFPYAKSRSAPPNIVDILALKRVFDRSYPNHFYRIEPQAAQYTTHGDLWDWLMDRRTIEKPGGVYIPWTLELGSWIWLKKNPRQAFSSLGAFNPVQPHRLKRIRRRHLTLFDFLHRALLNPEAWTMHDEKDKHALIHRAMELWYER